MTISPIKPNYVLPPRLLKLNPVRNAVLELQVGDGRELCNGDNRTLQTYVLMVARRAGIKVETRKLNGTGLAVKRVK